MGNYLLAYTGGIEPTTEEEGKASMAAWMAWFESIGPSVVDGGNPFGPAAAISPDGTVTIGAPSRLTGYSVISADSLDAAVALAKGCPHLSAQGTVEVYETFDVM